MIDIDNLNPSTKFPYPLLEEGEPVAQDEWVSVRTLSSAKVREIDEITIEPRSEFVQPKKANGKIDRRAPLQRIEYSKITDQTLREKLMWDEIIDEIHIYDINGVLIPSTTEVKIKLMSESAVFAEYIADCLEILTESEQEKGQRLEKNFLSSQLE